MKYQHVIYNSSERNLNGSVGFGVRSVTEGTPTELLTSLEDNGVFSFLENGKAVSPSALMADPSLIRNIVPTYFFQAVPSGAKGTFYALGRKIAVGFDYTFYLNGKPGRLGNYVVDTYVFDRVPSAEEFEILMEDAASGSNHFIPESPVPLTDNLEMREISLGHNPSLPIEEKSFRAFGHPKVSDEAVELLFAFMKSREEEKPLLVTATVEEAPKLMAQVARMMPESRIGDLTFLTNHAEEGKKRGINIVFINEYYTFEIFRKQWVSIDLTAGEKCDSKEAGLFRAKVKEYIAQDDFKSLRNLVDWCMSSTYRMGLSASVQTQTDLYTYVYEFDKFSLNNFKRDNTLRRILNELFNETPDLRKRLDVAMLDWFDSLENLEGLWQWIDFILAALPIDFNSAVEVNKSVITNSVFENEETFLSTYRHFASVWPSLQRFFKNGAYADNDYILSKTGGDERWFELYPYFLSDKLDKHEYLIDRMIADSLRPELRKRVVAQRIGSPDDYAAVLTRMIAAGNPNEDVLVAELRSQFNVMSPGKIDFFGLLSSKVGDQRYDDIFMWQLENSTIHSGEDLKSLVSRMLYLVRNSAPGRINRRQIDTLNSKIESKLKLFADSEISLSGASAICNTLNIPEIDGSCRFGTLSKFFNRETSLSERELEVIWDLALDMKVDSYLKKLLPMKFKDTERRRPKDLISLVQDALDHEWCSVDELTNFARKSNFANYYFFGIIRSRISKPREQHAYLVEQAGKSDDEAMAFLKRHLPESYDKVLKSRQPGIFSKLKGLFGGKKNDGAEDNDPKIGRGCNHDKKAKSEI